LLGKTKGRSNIGQIGDSPPIKLLGKTKGRSNIGQIGDSPPIKLLGKTKGQSALTVYGQRALGKQPAKQAPASRRLRVVFLCGRAGCR
jgi:hypothetical protein